MLIRFSLPSEIIPSNAKISKAILSLYAATKYNPSYGNGPKRVFQITKSWNENSVTWNSRPSTASQAIATSSNTATSVWEDYDVTATVKEIVENNAPNNGFMVAIVRSGYKGVNYCSSEHSTVANRPKLTVTFTAQDMQAPTVTITAPTANDELQSGSASTIRWTATDNIGVVSRAIYFSDNNGTSWTKVDSATTNTGSFNWTVPDADSKECLIKIHAYDAAKNCGTKTSGKFTVSPQSSIIPGKFVIKKGAACKVTIVNVQGKEIFSTEITDISQLHMIKRNLPSGIHIIKLQTQDMKAQFKLPCVQ